jgi:hypothetical protein
MGDPFVPVDLTAAALSLEIGQDPTAFVEVGWLPSSRGPWEAYPAVMHEPLVN